MEFKKVVLMEGNEGSIEMCNRALAMQQLVMNSECFGITPSDYMTRCVQGNFTIDGGTPEIGGGGYRRTVTVKDTKLMDSIVYLQYIKETECLDRWMFYVYNSDDEIFVCDGTWKIIKPDGLSLVLDPVCILRRMCTEAHCCGKCEEDEFDPIMVLFSINDRLNSIENRLARLESRTSPTQVTIKGGKIIKKEVKKIEETMYENLESIMDDWLPTQEEYVSANNTAINETVGPYFENMSEMMAVLEHKVNQMEVNLLDAISMLRSRSPRKKNTEN